VKKYDKVKQIFKIQEIAVTRYDIYDCKKITSRSFICLDSFI